MNSWRVSVLMATLVVLLAGCEALTPTPTPTPPPTATPTPEPTPTPTPMPAVLEPLYVVEAKSPAGATPISPLSPIQIQTALTPEPGQQVVVYQPDEAKTPVGVRDPESNTVYFGAFPREWVYDGQTWSLVEPVSQSGEVTPGTALGGAVYRNGAGERIVVPFAVQFEGQVQACSLARVGEEYRLVVEREDGTVEAVPFSPTPLRFGPDQQEVDFHVELTEGGKISVVVEGLPSRITYQPEGEWRLGPVEWQLVDFSPVGLEVGPEKQEGVYALLDPETGAEVGELDTRVKIYFSREMKDRESRAEILPPEDWRQAAGAVWARLDPAYVQDKVAQRAWGETTLYFDFNSDGQRSRSGEGVAYPIGPLPLDLRNGPFKVRVIGWYGSQYFSICHKGGGNEQPGDVKAVAPGGVFYYLYHLEPENAPTYDQYPGDKSFVFGQLNGKDINPMVLIFDPPPERHPGWTPAEAEPGTVLAASAPGLGDLLSPESKALVEWDINPADNNLCARFEDVNQGRIPALYLTVRGQDNLPKNMAVEGQIPAVVLFGLKPSSDEVVPSHTLATIPLSSTP